MSPQRLLLYPRRDVIDVPLTKNLHQQVGVVLLLLRDVRGDVKFLEIEEVDDALHPRLVRKQSGRGDEIVLTEGDRRDLPLPRGLLQRFLGFDDGQIVWEFPLDGSYGSFPSMELGFDRQSKAMRILVKAPSSSASSRVPFFGILLLAVNWGASSS